MNWPPLDQEIQDRWYILHQSTAEIARAVDEPEHVIDRRLARLRESRRIEKSP